jgi:prevent-host-death family protein
MLPNEQKSTPLRLKQPAFINISMDPMDKPLRQIGVTEFKANCSRLLDQVAQRRLPVVITKRGKPVAKLVPVDEGPIDRFGCMAGTVTICRDIISPVDDLEWTADEENICVQSKS